MWKTLWTAGKPYQAGGRYESPKKTKETIPSWPKCFQITPWNNLFCNNCCNDYKNNSTGRFSLQCCRHWFVRIGKRTCKGICFVKWLVCNFTRLIAPKHVIVKGYFRKPFSSKSVPVDWKVLHLVSATSIFPAQNRESQAWNRQKFRSEKQKKSRATIKENRRTSIQNRHPNRILSMPKATFPVSPYPPNLGDAISPPKFWGGVSETPCFTMFSEGRPLNWGGEIATPKFRGYGLIGLESHKSRIARFQERSIFD